jgi:hypothetical protein
VTVPWLTSSASRPGDNPCSIIIAITTSTLVSQLYRGRSMPRSATRTARHHVVFTLMVRLAPIIAIRRARGGRVKVAAPDRGRGARSARNLDEGEHVRTISSRSERSHRG